MKRFLILLFGLLLVKATHDQTAAYGGTDSSGNPADGTVYTIAGLPPK